MVVYGDEEEGGRDFIDISNIQFFNLKGILLFFWEFYIGIECIYNKNLFKEVKRERIEYGKQMDLGQCI